MKAAEPFFSFYFTTVFPDSPVETPCEPRASAQPVCCVWAPPLASLWYYSHPEIFPQYSQTDAPLEMQKKKKPKQKTKQQWANF